MADTPIAPDPVHVADAGAVRTVTVNRPDKLNALDRATLQGLDAAFAAELPIRNMPSSARSWWSGRKYWACS